MLFKHQEITYPKEIEPMIVGFNSVSVCSLSRYPSTRSLPFSPALLVYSFFLSLLNLVCLFLILLVTLLVRYSQVNTIDFLSLILFSYL